MANLYSSDKFSINTIFTCRIKSDLPPTSHWPLSNGIMSFEICSLVIELCSVQNNLCHFFRFFHFFENDTHQLSKNLIRYRPKILDFFFSTEYQVLCKFSAHSKRSHYTSFLSSCGIADL